MGRSEGAIGQTFFPQLTLKIVFASFLVSHCSENPKCTKAWTNARVFVLYYISASLKSDLHQYTWKRQDKMEWNEKVFPHPFCPLYLSSVRLIAWFLVSQFDIHLSIFSFPIEGFLRRAFILGWKSLVNFINAAVSSMVEHFQCIFYGF